MRCGQVCFGSAWFGQSRRGGHGEARYVDVGWGCRGKAVEARYGETR